MAGDGTATADKPPPKQVGGATDKQHPFKVKRLLLKVSVRTDFLVRAPFLLNAQAADGVEFHWGGEAVANATVALPGADVVLTDASGVAKVDVTNVPDGTYNLVLYMASPSPASTPDAAGPALARGLASPPSRIYRPMVVTLTLAGGKITAATDPYNPDTGTTWGRIGNRNQHKWTGDHLPIDYRPVWITSPRERTLRTATDVTLVVCHCTGGPIIGSTINTFKSAPAGDSDSAHYVVDHDGHIIKFCREDHLVDHAGITVVWDGVRSTNPISVGIEMVHRSKDTAADPAEIPYNKYQIQALQGLLHALVNDTTLRIPAHRIVGHSDVDSVRNKNGTLGSRDTDPGQNFPWETLEADSLGMIPQSGVDMDTAYSGFFSQFPKGSLRKGDNDAHKKWGGEKTKGIPIADTAPPVQELQEDLGKIGYTVDDAQGVYDEFTAFQVRKFQWHFFSFNRKRSATGVLDLDTAKMIKSVKSGIP